MAQYMLSVYPGDELDLTPDEREKVFRDVDVLNAELQKSGAWVFACGLHQPSTATVVRVKDSDVITTDGPYVEGGEHIGGFWIIEAADLDAALDWSRKATRACAAPVEVRPVQGVVSSDPPS